MNEDFENSQAAQEINEPLSSVPKTLDEDIFHNVRRTPETEISDQQALLAPPTVAGYVLHSKVWAEFLVSEVNDIEWDDTCFSKLAIDERTKTMLKVLVDKHEQTRVKFHDIVERKGIGRVFLLHGPPGAGKTLTAGKTIDRGFHPSVQSDKHFRNSLRTRS